MADHAKFSPSKSQRTIACPGSHALESEMPDSRSEYADEGTGAHHIASICLKNGEDADGYVGNSFDVDEHGETTLWPGAKGKFKIDDSFAGSVQVYLDEVRRRAYGKTLLVEQRVEFSETVGVKDQFGTSDAIIIDTREAVLEVGDLKFGMGVKVYAERNEQMMNYAGAVLETFADILPEIKRVRLFISQPRLDHLDEWECDVADIHKFMSDLKNAILVATVAMKDYQADRELIPEYFKAGEKQCQFCKAKGFCPTLRQTVAKAITDDFKSFDTEESIGTIITGPPLRVASPRLLGNLYGMLDLITSWATAVRSETERLVMAGTEVIGPDGLRMKLVEGKKGKRVWTDEAKAEALLLGHLPPEKAYAPRKIITAPAASDILNKKKTAATWENFKTLIKQSDGAPSVVLGSDPRPEWKGEAKDCEFENLDDDPTM